MSKVEFFKGKDHQWRWRLRAANGEIVATGESYTRREDAERGFHDAVKAMIGATA